MDDNVAIQEQVDKIETTTKKGFDLKARLEGRGLRKSTITLYLDEEIGVEIGYAEDLMDNLNRVKGRARSGVVGEIDVLKESRQQVLDAYGVALKAAAALTKDATETEGSDPSLVKLVPEPDFAATDEKIAELEAKRDELIARLTGTGITVRLQAVPPVIYKDCRRKAKETLGIKEKNVPADLADEFKLAQTAHLMTVMFKSVTDVETGETNDKLSYDDAIALMDYLPPSQFHRLDLELGKVQFTDAISRDIESQEDFS